MKIKINFWSLLRNGAHADVSVCWVRKVFFFLFEIYKMDKPGQMVLHDVTWFVLMFITLDSLSWTNAVAARMGVVSM
jgi:hypothetical protein